MKSIDLIYNSSGLLNETSFLLFFQFDNGSHLCFCERPAVHGQGVLGSKNGNWYYSMFTLETVNCGIQLSLSPS